MGVQALIRAADVFFTTILMLIASLGVVLVWAMGNLNQMSAALLAVALVAPGIYRARAQRR